jgi:energy-coupling factor transporter ATP-binding protein EcfA2
VESELKISEFEIQNFRGIVLAKAIDLRSTVIIAGQNGSGKSCILDALRLLKSAYGGYQQNEWHQWMGEFSINVNSKRDELVGIFNNPRKPVQISFRFELHPDELSYIRENLEDLLLDHVFRTHIPEAYAYGAFYMARFASQFREREPEMRERAAELKPQLEAELSQPSALGVISVQPGGRMNVSSSLLLPIVFSAYLPQKLGILDYHGPQRHYGRDPAQNVNLILIKGNKVKALTHYIITQTSIKT